MEKKQSLKRLAIPVLVFILGFGLMAGCNDKKSNEDEGNNSEDMEMSQNGNNQDQMNQGTMDESQEYTADLEGDNEVPAVETDASGMVTVTMNDDGSVHMEGQFSDLSSNYTGSHVHMAVKGENGDVVKPLDPTVNSDKTSGSWNADVDMNAAQMEALKAGKLYINVHSQNHKNGEIRGQLTSSDMGMDDSMNDDDSMDN